MTEGICLPYHGLANGCVKNTLEHFTGEVTIRMECGSTLGLTTSCGPWHAAICVKLKQHSTYVLHVKCECRYKHKQTHTHKQTCVHTQTHAHTNMYTHTQTYNTCNNSITRIISLLVSKSSISLMILSNLDD